MMRGCLFVVCLLSSCLANAHTIRIENEIIKSKLAFYSNTFTAQAFVDSYESAKYDANECARYTPEESAKLANIVKKYERVAQEKQNALEAVLDYALVEKIFADDRASDVDNEDKKADCLEFKRQAIEQSLIEDYANRLEFSDRQELSWGELPSTFAFTPTEFSLLVMDIVQPAMNGFCLALDKKYINLGDLETKVLNSHQSTLKSARTKLLFNSYESTEQISFSPKNREMLWMSIGLAANALESGSKELEKSKAQSDPRPVPEKAVKMCESIYNHVSKGMVPEYYRLTVAATGKKVFEAW